MCRVVGRRDAGGASPMSRRRGLESLTNLNHSCDSLARVNAAAAESDTKPFMRSSAVAGVTDSIRVLAASNHPFPEHPPSYP